MAKKKYYYLHVSYRAQFDGIYKYTTLDSDRFFRLKSCTLKELRRSIFNSVEKETGKKVKSVMIISVTELSEDLFNMLMESESFEDLDTSGEEETDDEVEE